MNDFFETEQESTETTTQPTQPTTQETKQNIEKQLNDLTTKITSELKLAMKDFLVDFAKLKAESETLRNKFLEQYSKLLGKDTISEDLKKIVYKGL